MFDFTLLESMTNESFMIFTTIFIILALYFIPFTFKIFLVIIKSIYILLNKLTIWKK